jgi:phosphoethanolamine N-methyltransferase
MIKLPGITHLEALDREETLALLPPLTHARIVELACGIGRFSGELAKRASHLTCIEIMPEFLEINRQAHASLGNVDFLLADAMDVEFAKGSVDFVFVNWLLLYLTDQEAECLTERISSWLPPKGQVFFRETCAFARIEPTTYNPSTYRPRNFYEKLFQKDFQILQAGTYTCWLDYVNQPFSSYWLLEKK